MLERQYKKISYRRKNLELQVSEAYEKGFEALKIGDVIFAAKNLMRQNFISTINLGPKISFNGSLFVLFARLLWKCYSRVRRFILIYPFYKNIDYAYYLMGLCYYEQIVDEKKDLKTIIKQKKISS